MKHVFIDTNILVDYALGREHADDAEQLLQHGKNGDYGLAASYLTFANMAYILGRKVDIYDLFRELHSYIAVLPTDDAQLTAAIRRPVRDFEDMLQYQCAKAADCDVIVTNNKKDFLQFCDLPLFTAEEFLLGLD